MQVEANGTELNTSWDGPESAPIVVMSHSLAAHSGMWRPQVEALADRYRILRFDTRGHGSSAAPDGPYDMDLLAADLVGLLDALDVGPVHFVGLSMGGMIGQTLAIKHPDRVISLALCDTTSAMPAAAQPMWDERVALAEANGMPALVEPTLERWFTTPFRAEHGARIEPISEMIRTTPLAGFVGCCRAIQRLALTDRLAQIGVPTLIVVGEEDQGTPVAASEAIHERIAGSELVVLKSAAHLSNWEQPAAFNSALGGFLDAVAPR